MSTFAFHISITLALIIAVGLGGRVQRVVDVSDDEKHDHAIQSVGAMNKTNASRSHTAIDVFHKIVHRSCMTDLANRWISFSEKHSLLKIHKTHTSFMIPHVGDLGGKIPFSERTLNVIQGKTLQEALVDHWDAEDEKWAGAMGLGEMMKGRNAPNWLANKMELSKKTASYNDNMDTIDSYGFSLHGAETLCNHQVDAPSIDALRKCELEATASENPSLQTWAWWVAGTSKRARNKVKKVLAVETDDTPYGLPPQERAGRIAEYILGGDIFGQKQLHVNGSKKIHETRKIYMTIDETAYTMNQNFLRFQYDPVVTSAREGSLQKLVEFTLDKQYNLMMLKSVTSRVFKLEGEDEDATPVNILIDHEEKGLWMAETMLVHVFGFSITRAAAYCKKKATKEGFIPFSSVATQSKIMQELTEPTEKRDGKCLERDGMYCPEGYSPQSKVGTEKAATVALEAAVWSGPVAHVLGLAFDVALGLPGTGLALSIPGSWVLWVSAPLAVILHDLVAQPCACNVDQCTQSSEHGRCVINALAPSSNPYRWLPFPGTKCAPLQMDASEKAQTDFAHKMQIRDNGKCTIQPCASGDYNKEGYQGGELRGVIGAVHEGEPLDALYNCLSVDGSSVGSILRATSKASLQVSTPTDDELDVEDTSTDELDVDDTPTDNGMAVRERVQLYGKLGLHSD